MGRLLSPVLYEVAKDHIAYQCPGCGERHQLPIGVGSPAWFYNGNPDKPTFSPSILARGIRSNLTDEEMDAYQREFPGPGTREAGMKSKYGFICHHFVRDGKIEFLGDCTHDKKNQTLEMVPWPAYS